MKKTTLGLVAAQLFVMYSLDEKISSRVNESNEPYNELMSIGYEMGIHDIPDDDIERNGILAELLEPLFCDDTECFCE